MCASRLPPRLCAALTRRSQFILSWLAQRGVASIIQIDPYSGSLLHLGLWGHDLFPSLEAAKAALSSAVVIATETYVSIMGRSSHLASSAAYALLGHIVMGDEAYLMIATKIRESVTLPGGHSVYSIVDSRAVRIPLWRSFVEASATQTRAHAGPPSKAACLRQLFCLTACARVAALVPVRECALLLRDMRHHPALPLAPRTATQVRIHSTPRCLECSHACCSLAARDSRASLVASHQSSAGTRG